MGSKPGIQRTCEVCNKSFVARVSEVNRGRGKYCSKECANESRYRQVACVCEACGKEFMAFPSNLRKYCSRECYKAHKAVEHVSVNCLCCNKLFSPRVTELERGRGKYCSKTCFDKAVSNWTTCTCQQCGKEFKALMSQVTGKYCSRKCADDAKRRQTLCACSQCGQEFVAKRGSQKYCSKQCANEAARDRLSLTCQYCGKVFEVKKYQIDTKYCSRKCKGLAKRGKIESVCRHCGRHFQTLRSYIKKGGGKYCSRKCAGLAHSGIFSPVWRGGTIQYRGANWRQQRNIALVRDQGACQICGYVPERDKPNNPVHHIRPFRDFGSDYLSANRTENLVTLCRSCHKMVESGRLSLPERLL